MKSLLQDALSLRKKGLSVIPLQPKGKKPLIEWKQFQTELPTEKQIAEWWNEYPLANVGIVTGPISNLTVLDIDSFDIKPSQFPKTLVAQTGKGFHLYYKHAEGIGNSARVNGEPIDIRGEGGFVVAPPSVHESGRSYKWLDTTTEVAPFPKHLTVKPTEAHTTLQETIMEGNRNDTLHKIALSLLAKLDEEMARRSVHDLNQQRCSPPLSTKEVDTLFDSAIKFFRESPPHAPLKERATVTPEEFSTKLHFVKWGEMSEVEAQHDWLIEGLLYRGGMTLLSGAPKVGKSTFTGALLRSLAEDSEFLGKPTKKSRVLVLSEEDEATWYERGLGFSVLERNHIEVAFQPFTQRLKQTQWEDILKQLGDKAASESFDLVVLDTLSDLWPVWDENSATDVERALTPIRHLTRTHNLAVLCLHHERKSGGDNGSAARGSSAIVAKFPIILSLQRDRDQSSRRVLSGNGRSRHIPEALVLEHVGGEFVVAGTKEEVKEAPKIQACIGILKEVGEASAGFVAEELKKLHPVSGVTSEPSAHKYLWKAARGDYPVQAFYTKTSNGKEVCKFRYTGQSVAAVFDSL